MNKLLNKKIKFHEFKISESEVSIEFHKERLEELKKETKEWILN